MHLLGQASSCPTVQLQANEELMWVMGGSSGRGGPRQFLGVGGHMGVPRGAATCHLVPRHKATERGQAGRVLEWGPERRAAGRLLQLLQSGVRGTPGIAGSLVGARKGRAEACSA